MTDATWEDAVHDILFRVGDGHPLEETGYQLAAAACELGEFMVQKVERSQCIEGTLACEKGCSLCCHAQVPISKPEGDSLMTWISENLTIGECDAIGARVDHNLELTHGCSLDERVSVWDQTPCIFLQDCKCQVYLVRPLVCRAWHSTDKEQCRKAFSSRVSGAEIDNTPYRNYVLGVVRDELARLRPWPKGGVLPLPEAMALLISAKATSDGKLTA